MKRLGAVKRWRVLWQHGGGYFSGKPLTKKEHVLRGLHSRMPACCVELYVTAYSPRLDAGYRGSQKDQRWVQRYDRALHLLNVARRAHGLWQTHYAVCPACIRAGRVVRIHRCSEACKRQPGSCWPLRMRIVRKVKRLNEAWERKSRRSK